jgi:hypothetical protein
MLNLRTDRQKTRELNRQLRLMANIRNSFIRRLTARINRIFVSSANAFLTGEQNAVNRSIEKHTNQLNIIMRKLYISSGSVFSADAITAVEKLEEKGTRQDFWAAFRVWATSQAASQVSKIQNTNRLLMAQLIDKGFREGQSKFEIAKQIRNKGLETSRVKAFRIADTETHNASVFATDKAMEATKVQMNKEWRARFIRTRQAHAIASNGKPIPQKALFNVGGEMMERPGDSSHGATAKNIVNCHCVLLYHVVGQSKRELRR